MNGEETSRTPTNQLVRAGLEEQSLARRTGEPTHYTRSERALRQALAQDPNDVRALIGLASLANTRHHFREGLALARRVRSLAPDMALAYGVMGDALVELGRFEAGYRAYEKMAEPAEHRSLCASRAGSGGPRRERLGPAHDPPRTRLRRGCGDPGVGVRGAGTARPRRPPVRGRRRPFRNALAVSPGNPLALEAWGETEAARGNRSGRSPFSGRRSPRGSRRSSPSGRPLHGRRKPKAAATYDLVQRQEQRLAQTASTPTSTGRCSSSSTGSILPGSLALARRGYAQRPGTEASEVLSWALVRNGQCKEAVRYSTRPSASRTGTAISTAE